MQVIHYDFVRATVADRRCTAQVANRGRVSRWLRQTPNADAAHNSTNAP